MRESIVLEKGSKWPLAKKKKRGFGLGGVGGGGGGVYEKVWAKRNLLI